MFAASKSGQSVVAATDPYFKYVPLLLETTSTNGQQNNTFLDSGTANGGVGFTITRNGTPTQGSVTPYWPDGYWSNYIIATAAIYNASISSMNFGASTNFTIEAWVNWPAAAGANQTYFELSGTTRMILGRTTTGFRAYWNGTEKGAAYTFAVGTWYHIAVVRNSGTVSFYINGSLLTSFTDTVTWTGMTRFNIGSNADAQEPMTGYVSNLRVVNGTAVYTGAFTPPTSPLTAITNTQLLTCQSNRFKDNSTNTYTLSTSGVSQVQAFQPFSPTASYTAAAYGGSGYFNGSSDWLSVPDNAAFALGSGDFTAECWIYPTSFANEAMVMGQWSGDVGGTTLNWALLLSSGSTGYLRLITSSNGSSVLFDLSTSTTSFTLTLNTWQHIAAVRSGTTFTIYVNGVSRASTTNASGLFDATNTFTIGAESNTQAQYFTGYISNARLVKGTPIVPPSGGPTTPVTAVSGTSLLLNFTNAGIYDAAVQNNVITVGDAQSSTTITAKWPPTSMKFDGTGDYLQSPFQTQFQLGSGNFTIEFWVYFNSVASGQRIAGQDNSASNVTWAFYIPTSGTLTYYLSSSGSAWNIASGVSMGSVATGTWYYVALVRNGSTFTPYINSVAGTTTTSSAALFASTAPLTIGADASGPTSYFNGYIQDFRLTKGVARTITTPTAAFPTR